MTYSRIGRALAACAALAFGTPVLAQSISITALNSAYTQNFDSLAATGTSSTLPTGWALAETGGSANTTYTAGNGGGTAGDTYSFGSAAAPTDRAFGSLQSGSVIPVLGAQFTNNSGAAITSLSIVYTGEQWRLGAINRAGGAADKFDFQYSLNATSLATGAWTDVDALDFISPITVGTVGALDGNVAANRTALSSTITGLNIPNGATFWIRWNDFNVASSDDGDAIDDFSLTALGAAAVTPTLTLTAPATINEGDTGTSIASFAVHLSSAAPAGGVSFAINTIDATATAGSDYVAILNGSGSIAAGQTDITVDVTINGDTSYENNEGFQVQLSGISNTTNTSASADGTILNDDPIPTLSVNNVSVLEGNAGTNTAVFTVTMDRTSINGVTFFAKTLDDSATTADNDYVALPNTQFTIPAGATSTTVSVTVNGDTAIEGDEQFILQLSTPNNAIINHSDAFGTITNDDAVTPTFSIANASKTEGDSGTSILSFSVSSNVAAPPAGYTFTAATSNGTATAGEDYVANSASVTIPSGATSATFDVVIDGDRKFESDETFVVTLSGAPGGTQISASNGVATGTIQNDDVKPALSIADASIAEGNSGTSTLTFTAHLDAPALEGGVTFDIATQDGTATVANNDYVAASTTGKTIAAGQQDATFIVTINGDTTLEADETFGVNVSNATGTSNATASATGTITNDDPKPALSIGNASIAEGNSGTTTLNFSVSLTTVSPTAVNFTVNTANGTATAGSDYVAIVNGAGSIAAGSLSTTVSVTVNGDTTTEANETFNVNLSAITNAANTTASAIGTITNDDNIMTIAQIQGDGVATSVPTTSVISTRGIVTAKKASGSGYFIQDPVGDGNPATSEGIYVFAPVAAVSVGDDVTLVAKVQEFNGSTELSTITSVTVNSQNNPLPAAFVFDSHPPSNDPLNGYCTGSIGVSGGPQAHNFACFDGMLVQVNDGVVTGATFGSSATNGANPGVASGFYGTLSGVPTPYREKGLTYPGATAGIPVFDGNPEVFEVYFPGLNFNGAAHIYDTGAHFSVTGPIQAFKAATAISPLYEIYPTSLTDGAAAPSHIVPVSDSAVGTLTIGTQNLLHFFNAAADGADTTQYTDACVPPATNATATDTCPTAQIYAWRLSKMAKQLCHQLKAPAVLNLQEVENKAVLDDLKTAVFTECGVIYRSFTFQGNDPGGINTGLLLRSDVIVNSVTQLYKGSLTTAGCSGVAPYGTPPCLINDRPPVLLDGAFNGLRFAFLSVYDRSLSGLEGLTPNYVGKKRTEQAVQIAKIVQAWQSGATLAGAGNARLDGGGAVVTGSSFDLVGDASVPLVVAGDFNAYEFTDGYVDVTGMIMGTAVQSENLYWDESGTYVPPSPTLIDSGVKADPAGRYSFNFSGFRQEIDHILVTRAAYKDFVSISNSHGNSDVAEASPIILDPSTPARSGDHDGQVITLATDRIFAHDFEAAP